VRNKKPVTVTDFSSLYVCEQLVKLKHQQGAKPIIINKAQVDKGNRFHKQQHDKVAKRGSLLMWLLRLVLRLFGRGQS